MYDVANKNNFPFQNSKKRGKGEWQRMVEGMNQIKVDYKPMCKCYNVSLPVQLLHANKKRWKKMGIVITVLDMHLKHFFLFLAPLLPITVLVALINCTDATWQCFALGSALSPLACCLSASLKLWIRPSQHSYICNLEIFRGSSICGAILGFWGRKPTPMHKYIPLLSPSHSIMGS
jgi:hypothetical protein